MYLLEDRQPCLKASSVAQYLAGLRKVASLLQWDIPGPDLYIRQLLDNKGAQSARARFQKEPILPSTIRALSDSLLAWLATPAPRGVAEDRFQFA